MMRRAVSVSGLVLACCGVAVAAAPGAMAAAYPGTDVLRDAAGTASGCVATAVAPKANPGRGTFSISVTGTCVPGWERIVIDVAIIDVPVGAPQVAIVPRSTIAITTNTLPTQTDMGAGVEYPCSPGRHEYIGRWYPKVKHGVSDPNPFKTTVQARAVVVCS
jgi:hypothetical protein